MYTVHIPTSHLHEARLYLEQNYYAVNRDYNYYYYAHTVEFTIKDFGLYERFTARFGPKISPDPYC